ncbi:MAG TPA: ATP-binding protein, partial [Phycisphaerales bacterium]|nr:ATP-binding protein [Phycisphaerales bacterium]
ERYVAIRTDITDRKRIEEQLRQSDSRKDEFLAVLSHELRNPMAAIRMATNVLKADGRGAHEQMLSIIERQSQQLSRLVDDLLDVSRITRGKIGLRLERVDLAGIVAEAGEGAHKACEEKGIDFALTLPSERIYVMGDALRMSQVLGNLLSNAIKFTPAGGHISLIGGVEGDQAVVRVRDTGIGIPTDQLLRVFEMFAQVDPVVRKTGGLGIGLALVKGITELHGGSVEARSDGPDKGSEFIVRLPLAHAPALAGTDQGGQAPAVAVKRPRRRILAVDDNADALTAIAHMLRLKGHEVIAAEGGAEAIDLAREHRPDVVLLDIGMPGMDGYEVARRIRREPWGRDLTLIAVTGWGQERDKRQAAEAGFNAHLTKPVEPDVLENLLTQPHIRPTGL